MTELAEYLRRLAEQLADVSGDGEQRNDQLMHIHDELLALTDRIATLVNCPE